MPVRAALQLVDGRAIGDAQLDAYAGWLSAAESARHCRFVRRERQRQFLIGRVLARRMLGELLGVAPRALTIIDRPGQAPVLLGNHGAYFSISHSGPWVACAVSAGSVLGLDIEMLDATRDTAALAAQAFDAERCAWLAARPAHSRLRDFYQLWSTQEARIKLAADAATTIALEHAALSVVLCSAQALSAPPQLLAATL